MALGAIQGTKQRSAEGLAGRGVAVALGLAAAFALSACDSRGHHEVPVASAADLSATSTIADATPTTDAATVAAPTHTAALTGDDDAAGAELALAVRSEARRVGKERVGKCRSRWSPDH